MFDVIDICARPGANIDSDHYLVQSKIRAKTSNAKKEKEKEKKNTT